MGKDFEKNLDILVEDAEERAKAAKQLREIALRYPDLLRQATKLLESEAESSTAPQLPVNRRTRRMSPTDAVRAWLRDHKEGTSGEIVNAVIGNVKSNSDKPESVIYSTIAVLKRRGLVEAEERQGQATIYRLLQDRNGTAH